ncbi:MAG: ISKra4 family transposase [Sulfitobacter sp.]|nr:ISKra4 family transposase [Sulfitobacter sp.]
MKMLKATQVDVTCSETLLASMAALTAYVACAKSSGAGVSGFRATEARITELGAHICTAAKAEVLSSYDATEPELEVDGVRYRRMPHRSRGRYMSLSGPVVTERHLYREAGVRNGATIVPLELRAGIVEGRWTPEAARAVAQLYQALPSREAADLCRSLGVLPTSRSSIDRCGEKVGTAWDHVRADAEEVLAEEMAIPDEARALSVSVDRVSLPMEERPSEAAVRSGRKAEVAYRQAYCATVTLHDGDGKPLTTLRYGHMPKDGRRFIEDSLYGDISIILQRRPDLRVVGLADGAPEMQRILDRVLELHDVEAVVIDFWHVTEKLSAAIRATGRATKALLADWKLRLLNDDTAIDAIFAELSEWCSEYVEEELPEELHEAFTYLDNNRERMRYASLRKANLPIGSGQVEATCKSLVAIRMKRAGSRWKHTGGQACIGLRALALSDRLGSAMDYLLDRYVVDVAFPHAA